MPQKKKVVRQITPDNMDFPATITEFARYLAVSDNTIRRMIKAGRINAFRVGEQWRIDVPQSLRMLGYEI